MWTIMCIIPSVSDHYSSGLRILHLKMQANVRAKELKEKIPEGVRPVLVFTGFSGIALATAVGLALHDIDVKFNMMLIRKEGEKSHGRAVHCDINNFEGCYFIFVDDFIDSGKTFLRMNTATKELGGIKLVCTGSSVFDADKVEVWGPLSENDSLYYSNLLRA